MRKPNRLPSDLPAHFTVRSALGAGATRTRLRARDLSRPFYGVRSREPAQTDAALQEALATRLTGTWAFSHQTAAQLYGAPLPRRVLDDGTLHVSVVLPRTPPRLEGVRGHRMKPDLFTVRSFKGFPVVTPEVAFCQMASVLRREDLVAIGDFLVSGDPFDGPWREPLASIETLTAAASVFRGGRGAKNVAWALPRIRAGVDSRPESLLRLLLVTGGLPEPQVHPAVAVDGGRAVVHPDLGYPQWRTAFEYEGDGHRSRDRWLRDLDRYAALRAAGWTVVQVTSDDLFRRPQTFLARTLALLGRA